MGIHAVSVPAPHMISFSKTPKLEFPGEQYDDVRGLVVSEIGFTGEALALQEEYSIDLMTLEQLFSSFLKHNFMRNDIIAQSKT
jgi:hypothetical protein